MSDTTTAPKTRTITLTGRAPVTIREDYWPIIAEGTRDDEDGRTTRGITEAVRVRQHADGRTLVYAYHRAWSQWQGEGSSTRRDGRLLAAPPSDVARVIRDVAEDAGVTDATIRQCVADLPAVVLD